MLRLEIVTHSWHYSRPLIFQLSSLILFPPSDVQVVATVFYASSDRGTCRVLEYFAGQSLPRNVQLKPWQLSEGFITRRMIGRNLAARATSADRVWFTDCDYVFRESCLDTLTTIGPRVGEPLAYPKTAYLSWSHEHGDQELLRVAVSPSVADITPAHYAARSFGRAIGGLQIVSGNVAREFGYCAGSRWHCVPSAEWVPTKDDVWFRRSLGTPGVPIHLPNLYRIRHSSRGGALLDGATGDLAHSPQTTS